jgi:hypothetical protein
MKLKIVDIGLALGAGLLVVFAFRLIENVSGMTVNGVVVAVLSTIAVIVVLRSRGAWPK